MADQSEDLWPRTFNPTVEDPEPVKLLKQQADLLARKTGGSVEGVVKESTIGGTVWYSLYLRAPALGDYMYKVLDIAIPLDRPPTDPFSFSARNVSDWRESESREKNIGTIKDFKDWLKNVLSSERVASVIGNLISRSEKSAAH